MTTIFSDRPIQAPEEDSFGRDAFAQAIANALVLPPGSPSIVVAVEGEWGSGKTSVINIAAHHLQIQSEPPLIIRLESWLLSGAGSTTETFLAQFAVTLGEGDKSGMAKAAAEKILRFAQLLGPGKFIPGAGHLIAIAQSTLESIGEGTKAYADLAKRDIQKMKVEVAEALNKTGRPIVVILDDLDRLEPEETRQVFRMIKAVADFERVAYLLGYDPAPVHHALSFGGIYDGAAYLEKIVQVAYPLPSPGYWVLKEYLRSRLETVLTRQKPQDFERERFDSLLSEGGLAQAIRHPRDVNRLLNRLAISLPATRDEVNAADVIAFEALSVRYSNVTLAIRKRPYEFIGGWLHHDEPLRADYWDRVTQSNDKAQKAELPSWLSALWKDLPSEERRPLIALLEFLFPDVIGRPYAEKESLSKLESELRICQRGPLLKLLAVGPTAGTPSAKEIVKFLTDARGRAALVQEIYASESAFEWLNYATNFLDRIPVAEPSNLVSVLLGEARRLASADRVAAYRFIGEISFFTLHLMKSLPQEAAVDIFHEIASTDISLSVSHNVILQVAKDHGLWIHHRHKAIDHALIISDRVAAEQGIALWLDSVRRSAFFQLLREPGAIDILFRWGQFATYAEVQDAIESFTATDEGVKAFHDAWLPGHGISNLHYLFKDWRLFRARCERSPYKEAFRSDFWSFFSSLEQEERKTPQAPSSSISQEVTGAAEHDTEEEG